MSGEPVIIKTSTHKLRYMVKCFSFQLMLATENTLEPSVLRSENH